MMTKYILETKGVLTETIKSFDEKPLPGEPHVWYEYVRNAPPKFNPATHKLGTYRKTKVAGRVVNAIDIVALTNQEKKHHVIRQRRKAYASGTMALKGIDDDEITGLGFWVDAIVGQLESMGVMFTPEMQQLIALRAKVKRDNPTP